MRLGNLGRQHREKVHHGQRVVNVAQCVNKRRVPLTHEVVEVHLRLARLEPLGLAVLAPRHRALVLLQERLEVAKLV